MTFAPNPIDNMSLGQILDADWRRLLKYSDQPDRTRRLTSSFSPRFACVVLLRIAHTTYRAGWPRAAKFFSLINFVINGIEAPASLAIGPGLVIPHSQGIVIGAGYVGSNVTIYQQVTLGAQLADFTFNPIHRPHVCDGVILTAGAKIIGPYRLGEHSIVGANAVVLSDVPANHLAVGVPARTIDRQARTELDA